MNQEIHDCKFMSYKDLSTNQRFSLNNLLTLSILSGLN
jgi:hypothetical protein